MIFDFVTNKIFKKLLDGVLPAGDSKKLGGKSASAFYSALGYATNGTVAENIQRHLDRGARNGYFFTTVGVGGLPSYDGGACIHYYEESGLTAAVEVDCFNTVTGRCYHAVYNSTTKTIGEWQQTATTADLTKRKLDHISCATLDEIHIAYANIHNNATDDMVYEAEIYHGVHHPTLGGGIYHVTGCRVNVFYGWQITTSYSFNTQFFRRLVNGTWHDWVLFATTEDLANYLPKSGGKVSTSSSTPFLVENTGSGNVMIDFLVNGVRQGLLGFNAVDSPIFYDSNHHEYKLLHNGNYTNWTMSKDDPHVADAKSIYFTLHDSANAIGSMFKNNGTSIIGGGFGAYGSAGTVERLYVAVDNTGASAPYAQGIGLDIYADTIEWKRKTVHHDGNSAKVVVSSTPLTAEGSVRVW